MPVQNVLTTDALYAYVESLQQGVFSSDKQMQIQIKWYIRICTAVQAKLCT